jgi:hypothetical protein
MNDSNDAVAFGACSRCLFHVEGDLDPNTLKRPIMCKKNPPSLVMLPTQNGMALAAMWPVMQPDAWCYSFAPDVSALAEESPLVTLS